MEKSMCKISFERIENNKLKKGQGSGFFCKLNNNKIKYALFTNNHVLNKQNIEVGNIIKFEYLEKSRFIFYYNKVKKEIKITEERNVFTNEKLDYTCIELLGSDEIINYFKIDPNIYKYDNNEILKNNDIFILQYPKGNDLSFSDGKILSYENSKMLHSASTEEGSSVSPIIRRCKDNYIIGLHKGGYIKNNKYTYNLGIPFHIILDDIKLNEINCIYILDKNEINLIHDYNLDISGWNENDQKLYLEAKNKNKKFFEENIELYINGKRTKFNYKYKNNKELKKIKVIFKFKKSIENMGYMFYNCSSLNSIDLSSFNTSNVTNMSNIFYKCSSLQIIDLSSFNTNSAINMYGMFYKCSSLKSLDLSSFNTNNVTNMDFMFSFCSSL